MLRAFMASLLVTLSSHVSLEQRLSLVFELGGACLGTPSRVVYGVNTVGVSRATQRLLGEIAQGRCAVGLQDQGKPIHVRLKDRPH